MKVLLAVYRAQLKTSFLMYLQYRASSVLWLLGMVLEPVIYLVDHCRGKRWSSRWLHRRRLCCLLSGLAAGQPPHGQLGLL
jgi:hypothetical protein